MFTARGFTVFALSLIAVEAASQERVAVQLKWHHQFQFAGYYAAQAKGFYQSAGLNVTILEGGASRPPLGTVLKGDAQFGVTDSDVVQARMKGSPTVACAVVFQHTPYVLLSRRDRNIRTPADLVGKTVMVSDDQGAAQFRAMLIREGIDPAQVKLEKHSWSLQDMIDGRVDVMSAYATVEPGLLRAKGVETSQLRSADYGVDFYGDTLFTTEAELAAHPARVEAFTKASMRGWEYAMTHPEEIADLILRMPGVKERGITREQLLQEAYEMRQFILSDVVEIGHMNPGRWQHIAQTFAAMGFASGKYSLDGFMFNPHPPRDSRLMRWLLGIGLGLTVLAAAALAWTVQLRRRVRERTGELQAQIEQRKRTEEALRASEARLMSVFSRAATGIAVASPDGHFIHANPAFLETVGYAEEELRSYRFEQLIHPGDRKVYREFFDGLLSGRGDSFVMEKRYLHKDGRIVWVRASVSIARFPAGGPINIIAVTDNVTALVLARQEAHQLNARLAEQAALLDKTQDAILVHDLDHVIRFWNKGAERLFGWTAQEAMGRNTIELLGPELEKIVEARRRVLEQGEWVGEIVAHRKNGREIVVQPRWTLMRDEAGRPESILSINTDITERKRLEAQFLRAQRLESIGTLAGGIAHDLNNLLAPIVMGIGLLRQMLPEERGRELLDIMEKSARRGANLVRQVLSFARGLEGARVIVHFRHVVNELESIIANTFPKNITFENKVPRDLWLVTGDPTQLNQVLLNLCVNARDAMPEGGRLVISGENAQIAEPIAAANGGGGGGRYAVVTVSDTGTGIPPGVIDKIFEPFFTTKEFGKGTGLGLSTALGIVRSHGGFMTVASEPGHGAVFQIHLPAAAENAGSPAVSTVDEHRPHGHGETILVVDDEASVLSITRQTLEMFDYKVLCAEDGARAISLYSQHPETVMVLTDMMMPLMDGPTLIAALRRINPQVRIVAATGLSDQEHSVPEGAPAVQCVLQKPYTADVLLQTVHAALNDQRV